MLHTMASSWRCGALGPFGRHSPAPASMPMPVSTVTGGGNAPQLLVLAAPVRGVDRIYDRLYDDILRFQADFARAIAGAGDKVLVLVDRHAEKRLLKHGLPENWLLRWPMEDMWMRDFTMVEPYNPIQFLYTPQAQSGSASDARRVQSTFNKLARKAGLAMRNVPLYLDGGNWVSDNAGRVIVTERFLLDNRMDAAAAAQAIRQYTGASQVCILPDDDPDGLGHADGMAMFLDSSTVCVNKNDEPMRSKVQQALRAAFPGINIVELPAMFDDQVLYPGFSSSSGIYVNAPVTDRAVYVPMYGLPTDQQALSIIRSRTRKTVVPVAAQAVCKLGGACRCLSLQLTGRNAEALLQYAQGY
mmetsp:Transcript_14241/g.33618  ORF Transcript_14241/g.33618 Transcript_14241/m.33618 type:complete len:358 (-) Transcript_14241:339-1412(-)